MHVFTISLVHSFRERAWLKVVAEGYARIFYRNSIDGGFFIPLEAKQQLTEEIQTGDELTIDLENYTLTNDTQSKQIIGISGTELNTVIDRTVSSAPERNMPIAITASSSAHTTLLHRLGS